MKIKLKKSTLFESEVVFRTRNIDGGTESTNEELLEKVKRLEEPSDIE